MRRLYDVGCRGAVAGTAMNIARWAAHESGTLRHSGPFQGLTASPRSIARWMSGARNASCASHLSRPV